VISFPWNWERNSRIRSSWALTVETPVATMDQMISRLIPMG
jgi:hypothetical protein